MQFCRSLLLMGMFIFWGQSWAECPTITLDPPQMLLSGNIDLVASRLGIEAVSITACVQQAIFRTLAASKYFYRFRVDAGSIEEVGPQVFLFTARHPDYPSLNATGQLQVEVEENEGDDTIICRFARPAATGARLVFALAWEQNLKAGATIERKLFYGIRKYVATAGPQQGTITDQSMIFTGNYQGACGAGGDSCPSAF